MVLGLYRKREMINMMLVPRRGNFDLFEDFFDDDFFNRKEKNMMKSDIKETKDKYIVETDLPGFEKENISVILNDGYLEIKAKKDNKTESNEEKFIRKERFYGECSRKFYVGDEIKQEDINAKFDNGILVVEVPKKELEDKSKEIKQIEIK